MQDKLFEHMSKLADEAVLSADNIKLMQMLVLLQHGILGELIILNKKGIATHINNSKS